MAGRKNSRLPLTAATADRHILYESSVQGVEGQLDMLERVFRNRRKRTFTTFREDFCGTAHLSTAWVRRRKANRAWGVDLHRPTLGWCRRNHFPHLDGATDRIHLLCQDVLHAKTPPVDVVGAFNFSFNVFKEREVLLKYFRKTYRNLVSDGMFFIDEFGGPDSHTNIVEKRKVKPVTGPDGRQYEPVTYIWEQTDYNPITHEIKCCIHFKFKDGTRLNRAFVYNWRLWTVPELRELLTEAGFKRTDVYLQGWDEDEEEADGVFRRRTRYDDWESWFGYVVAEK
jgi:cyclopropane fatty-acyl-phospholipid synthase-like methyltransferase